MRFKTLFAAVAMLAASFFTAAEAAPITYKLQGLFDGSIGGTPVAGETFVWTVTADTASEFVFIPGIFMVPALTNTIEVSGFGTLAPTEAFNVFFQLGAGQDGFIDTNLTGGISFINGALSSYAGTTSIGPLGVSPFFTAPVATDQGDFIVSTVTALTFQASTVPEPLTLALFGAGLAGLGALRRRKQKA